MTDPSVNARFKSRLRAREPLLGCFVKTPHPTVTEVLAASGAVDCICLDAEHGPFDRAALDQGLLAARAFGVPALVRTPSAEAHHILNALDLGAAGILVPHVMNGAQASAIARAAHYAADTRPGSRGYGGGMRSTGFAMTGMDEQLARMKAETSVVLQIEDAEALAEVEAIAGAPGVDAVFIGRIDLTVALGETDPAAASVLAAVRDATGRALAAGAAVGMFTPDIAELPAWRQAGASLFLLGSDHGFLTAGAVELRRRSGL